MGIKEWKNKGGFFEYEKQSVFYIVEGKGPVLVLIHGFPTSSWDWCKIWNELIKSYRVITLDMIGFGFSDKPQSYNYSIHKQASVYETLLKKLNVNSCSILAHDYGDTVTQELLARCNDKKLSFSIKSICLLNGGLFPEVHEPRLIQKLLISPIGFLISPLTSKKRFKSSFKAIFGLKTKPTDQEINDFWELINFNNGKKVMHKLIRYMTERKKYRERWVGALQLTKVPIRLIDGGFDPVSGKHMADRYKELVPNPDVILLEEIGHYPQTESPDLVLKYFLGFNKKYTVL